MSADRKPAARRSPKWPSVKNKHLASHPCCEVCGEKRRTWLNVHHVVPVHIDQSKELDPENLITLCEGEVVNCHLLYGHLRDWSSHNANVRQDAAEWSEKLKKRPE